eukprot:1159164-Pelagomonas_calceolata.AAC.8
MVPEGHRRILVFKSRGFSQIWFETLNNFNRSGMRAFALHDQGSSVMRMVSNGAFHIRSLGTYNVMKDDQGGSWRASVAQSAHLLLVRARYTQSSSHVIAHVSHRVQCTTRRVPVIFPHESQPLVLLQSLPHSPLLPTTSYKNPLFDSPRARRAHSKAEGTNEHCSPSDSAADDSPHRSRPLTFSPLASPRIPPPPSFHTHAVSPSTSSLPQRPSTGTKAAPAAPTPPAPVPVPVAAGATPGPSALPPSEASLPSSSAAAAGGREEHDVAAGAEGRDAGAGAGVHDEEAGIEGPVAAAPPSLAAGAGAAVLGLEEFSAKVRRVRVVLGEGMEWQTAVL